MSVVQIKNKKKTGDAKKLNLFSLKAVLSSTPALQEKLVGVQAKIDEVLGLRQAISKKLARHGDVRGDKKKLEDSKISVYDALVAIYKEMNKLNGEAGINDKLALIVCANEAHEKKILGYELFVFETDLSLALLEPPPPEIIKRSYISNGIFC